MFHLPANRCFRFAKTAGKARSFCASTSATVVNQEVHVDREWSRGPEAKKLMAFMYGKTKDSSTFEPLMFQDFNMLTVLERRFATTPVSASAMRVASATMTFPLTLSYGLRRIFSSGKGVSGEEARKELKILVLGARSESSLPSIWWRECLLSASDVIGEKLSISLMGPGLQTQQPTHTEYRHGSKSVIIKALDGGACLFHEHPLHMKLLLETDLFVMFNPGFGSTAALQESWAPTLRLLFMTRKPIMATAHSAWDLKRDLARLEVLTNEEDHQDLGEPLEFTLPPHENPMASTKRTFDSKEELQAQIVTTNQFIYAFLAK